MPVSPVVYDQLSVYFYVSKNDAHIRLLFFGASIVFARHQDASEYLWKPQKATHYLPAPRVTQ